MSGMSGTTFGAFFKSKRQQLGLTLREFCLKHELDPGNMSRVERGLTQPPNRDRLEQYASYLEIKKDSPDWGIFFDLAYAAKGEIPDDIMKDEELVQKLPAVYRTLRGKRVDDKLLDKLIKKVREG
mgnify:CR=1 FL=1